MSTDETGPGERPQNVAEFLSRMLAELNSQTGAVWIGENGQLVPVISIGLEDTQLFLDDSGKAFLQMVLTQTLTQGRVQIIDTEGQVEPKEFGHATMITAPFLVPERRPGIILVVQPPNLPMQQR